MSRFAARGRDRRSQGGFTLIETLVAIAISAIIIGPVGAWMVMVFTTQAPAAAGFTDAGQSRVLNTYLTRDVGSSEIVLAAGDPAEPTTVPTEPLVACADTPESTMPLVNLYDLGSSGSVVVYGTVDSPSGETVSLYRWECRLTAGYPAIDAVEVMRDMRTVGAVCEDDPDECSRVTVDATFAESGHETSVTATRRSSAASLEGFGGTAVPVPWVVEGERRPRTPDEPFRVDLLGGAWDPDTAEDGLGISWAVVGDGGSLSEPTGSATTFSASEDGTYEIVLTVTDGPNRRTLSYFVEFTNAPPEISSSSCERDDTVPRTWNCTASAADVDTGEDVTYLWRYPSDATGGIGTADESSATITLDPSLSGVVVIELVVADLDGGTTSDVFEANLGSGGPGDPGDPGDPGTADIVTSPGLRYYPGQPLPLLVSTESADPATRTARFSTSADPATIERWELLDAGGAEVAAGTDATLVHVFPQGDSGRYTVRLLRAGAEPVSLEFRVNAPPVASFGNTDPAASRTVTFTNTSTDDFGLRPTVRWDFNSVGPFAGAWTTTAGGASITYTSPGTYVVSMVVTDIDGLTSTATRVISVPGLPTPPNPPTWDPARPGYVTFPPVAGASGYTVVFSHTGTDAGGRPCARTVDVNVGLLGPFEARDTGNPCATPASTSAALRVTANGQSSPLSAWADR